jgi:hypothetical protein
MRSFAAVVLGAIIGCSGARRAPAACDLQAGPCTLPAGNDVLVTLEVSPRPIRALAELTFTVEARRGADSAPGAVEISLGMPGMYMGENRVALAAVGPGRHRGKGTVVRCGSGRRDWVAEVTLRPPDPAAPPLRAAFPFVVAE